MKAPMDTVFEDAENNEIDVACGYCTTVISALLPLFYMTTRHVLNEMHLLGLPELTE